MVFLPLHFLASFFKITKVCTNIEILPTKLDEIVFFFRQVFPLQPAWECGQLRPGDVLLKVDDSSLVSLTLRGALDVLRTSRPLTRLTVFRPPENRLESLFNNNSASPETPQTGGRDQMVNRSYSCNVNQDFAGTSSS